MNIPFSTVIIGLLILGFAFGGMYSIVSDGAADEALDITLTENYVEKFDFTAKIKNDTVGFSNTVQNLSVDNALFLALVPDAVSLLKNAFLLPFEIVSKMITSSVQLIGLPDWATLFFTTAAIIVLIFSFLAAVLRWKT